MSLKKHPQKGNDVCVDPVVYLQMLNYVQACVMDMMYVLI